MIFTKEDINFESEQLKMYLDLQDKLKSIILQVLNSLADTSLEHFNEPSLNVSYNYLCKFQTYLEKIQDNITNINSLSQKLETLQNTEENFDQFTEYNEHFKKLYPNITKINIEFFSDLEDLFKYIDFNFETSSTSVDENSEKSETAQTSSDSVDITEKNNSPKGIQNTDKNDIVNNTNKENEKSEKLLDKKSEEKSEEKLEERLEKKLDKEPTSETVSDEKNLIENTLLISEPKQVVVLPYMMADLENILNQNERYSSLQEIIEDKYTIPLSNFRFSPFARFRESYNLVKKRSHGSTKEALDLGLELFWNNNLNPAVIAGCRNVDELDIYLSYLEDNQLDKFRCFNVVFESYPIKRFK